tara:strand:+ start:4702 stop:5352 length:651 start_codon:yes stop_codon:yes gene_type:complete
MVNFQKNKIERRGLMFVLSSPSGAGKTTISRRLLKTDPNLRISISHTTRKRRPGESAGHDYHFVDEASFNDSISQGTFLEWAKVFGHYYGTPKAPVEDALANGHDILFDIDWQGTQQLGQAARGDLVTVFLLPPSWGELERRLIERAQDPHSVVQERMGRAADEISHWAEYDYVIVNDGLEHALEQVRGILESERLKRSRQTGMNKFVKDLCQKVS